MPNWPQNDQLIDFGLIFYDGFHLANNAVQFTYTHFLEKIFLFKKKIAAKP